MGSGLSVYARNKIVDHVLGTTAWAASPTAVYIALFVGDPIGAGSEVSGNGYARETISFASASNRSVAQNAGVTFNEASGPWGSVDYYAIYDALTSGNMLAYGALSSARSIVSGNTPSIASGEVEISINTGGLSDYLANAILDHIFNDSEYTVPTVYVALTSAAISDSDDGTDITELTMIGYAREAQAAWDAAASGASENSGLIDFGTLTSTGQTVEALCLTDNASTGAGNVLWYDNSESQAVANGDSVQIAIGDFDVALTATA